jgi:hypothetical protein
MNLRAKNQGATKIRPDRETRQFDPGYEQRCRNYSADGPLYFHFGLFFRVTTLHLLNMTVLGPMTGIITTIFYGRKYTENLNMGINFGNVFGKVQLVAFLLIFPSIVLYIVSAYSGNHSEMDEVFLVIAVFLVLQRALIIGIRHATTPYRTEKQLYYSKVQPEDRNESLILLAWTKIEPKAVMREIERSAFLLHIPEDSVWFRTLTPISPYIQDDIYEWQNDEPTDITALRKLHLKESSILE